MDVTSGYLPFSGPVPMTSFIDRPVVLATARRLLLRPDVRLLTLTGTGGVGKTRVAHALVNVVRSEFPDGTWFVPLAQLRNPQFLESAIAQVLGVRESAVESISERIALFLRSYKALLVLDNFEHLVAAGPVVLRFLAQCPRLKVVVTSRTRLRVSGEQELRVPPLPTPPVRPHNNLDELAGNGSIRLFVARARAADAGFALDPSNAEDVARICQHLDGLPLAIELAAARVKLLSPPVLRQRLEDEMLPLLAGGARDLPVRQHTMRDTIAWSYQLLSDAEQRLFRALSVFVSGWTLQAAEALVRDDPAFDVVGALGNLIDHNLVERIVGAGADGRYGMLETIREFAWTQAVSARESEMLRKGHSQFYMSLIHDAFPHSEEGEAAELMPRFLPDLDNFRLALRWCEVNDIEAGLRLAGELFMFWVLSGRAVEGAAVLMSLLEQNSKVLVDPEARAFALAILCDLLAWQSRYSEAICFGEEAVELGRNLESDQIVYHALNGICSAMAWNGDGRVEAVCRESLEMSRAVGHSLGTISSTANLGRAAHLKGKYSQAIRWLRQAMSIAREAKNSYFVGWILVCLAGVSLDTGDANMTKHYAEDALALSEEAGDAWGMASALKMLGKWALAEGDLSQAQHFLSDSLARNHRSGYAIDVAECVDALATLANAEDRYERVVYLTAAAAKIRATSKVPPHPAEKAASTKVLARARQRLGTERFDAVWADGWHAPLSRVVSSGRNDDSISRRLGTRISVSDLTRRESEILALLVDGRSNKDIATELFLSVRTVERHLANLYQKLGVRSRAGAIAWSYRQHSNTKTT